MIYLEGAKAAKVGARRVVIEVPEDLRISRWTPGSWRKHD